MQKKSNFDISEVEVIELPIEMIEGESFSEEEELQAVEFDEEEGFEDHLEINLDEEESFDVPDLTTNQLKKEFNDEFDEFQDTLDEYLDDVQEEKNEDLDKVKEDIGSVSLKDYLPGAEIRSSDVVREDDAPKSYSDGNMEDFVNYLKDQYPNKIPKHNGKSVMGCEKAIGFLKALSDEISRNVRSDREGVIDVETAEEYNQKIIFDILKLKKHLKALKRSLSDAGLKAASFENDESSFIKTSSKSSKMYVCITPFQRAISGILVNSVVSAGKPFEDVYSYLVEKYNISPREELELAQILMDMGYPLFKDRGDIVGEDESKSVKDKAEELSGVDFITQYFN